MFSLKLLSYLDVNGNTTFICKSTLTADIMNFGVKSKINFEVFYSKFNFTPDEDRNHRFSLDLEMCY